MLWISHLNRWFWGGLDWLFPPVCAGCRKVGSRWCTDCQQKVKSVPEPACDICGLPVRHSGLCIACGKSHPAFTQLRSWVVFEGPIRHALHSLKYRQNVALGDTLAQYLAVRLTSLAWKADLVVPVPLGKERMKERGYNQVSLFARPLSMAAGWKFTPRALWRVRETRSQVGLSVDERKTNMSGAFRADPALVTGNTVLLMDDVATTGATLSECSRALLDAGAKSVYALTLARALPHHGLNIV